MLKVNILRKVLDYSLIENIVYVPQVECLKDKIEMFYHLKGFKLRFWMFWNKDFSSVALILIAKKVSSNCTFDPFWRLTDFLSYWLNTEALSSSPVTWPSALVDGSHGLWPKRHVSFEYFK